VERNDDAVQGDQMSVGILAAAGGDGELHLAVNRLAKKQATTTDGDTSCAHISVENPTRKMRVRVEKNQEDVP
jgi:hypothetical protein